MTSVKIASIKIIIIIIIAGMCMSAVTVSNNSETPHKTHNRKVIRSVCITPDIVPNEGKSADQRAANMTVCVTALSTVAQVWNQGPPMNGWMQKMWHVSTMEIWK